MDLTRDDLVNGIDLPADLPYDPFRSGLYDCDELMEGWSPGKAHAASLDGRIYAHVKAKSSDPREQLAERIHDHAIDLGVGKLVSERPNIVGIMGSSRAQPSEESYAGAARVARLLTREGFLVASGGGLGIMEAANLGAYLANEEPDVLETAIDELGSAPKFDSEDEESQAAYIETAMGIREKYSPGSPSLAVPTWVYSGEPISQFATAIAKYFANSIREDGLLAICSSGIVYAAGRAGTSQEIFQDAAQNAYTNPPEERSPMVFVGVENYTSHTGLWDAVQRQSELFGPYPLFLSDDEGEAVSFIKENQPARLIEQLDGAKPDEAIRIAKRRARRN